MLSGEDEDFFGNECWGNCWRLALLQRANVVGPTTSFAVFTHAEAGSPGESLSTVEFVSHTIV
jgi:hypothetical protein